MSGEARRSQARRATEEILAAMRTAPRGVVVDSPPGAGKSTLVVTAAIDLASRGERVMVIAQTNEQVDDLTDAPRHCSLDSAAFDNSKMRGALGTREHRDRAARRRKPRGAPARAAARERARREGPGRARRPRIVLSTAHKWAMTRLPDDPWPWAIVDEAYQMRSDLLLRVAGLFGKALFVGDPGQLDPFSTVETDRFTGLSWDPMSSAVAVLLAHNPTVPTLRLPVSWRLPASAAPVISEAFYPFTPFRSATSQEERRLRWATRLVGDERP